jgi:hypothetical protein
MWFLFICALFYNAVSRSDYVALNGRMSNEWERISHEVVMA